MTQEIWKNIPDFQHYMVSNLGNVKSLKRTIIRSNGRKQSFRERILKPGTTINGYYIVVLIDKSGKLCTKTIHRLLLSSFEANISNKRCINHKNGIKKDNHIENLEWATHSENLIHAIGTGLNPKNKKVKCTTLDIGFDSITEASEKLGVNFDHITAIVNNRRTQTKGLTFKYGN